MKWKLDLCCLIEDNEKSFQEGDYKEESQVHATGEGKEEPEAEPTEGITGKTSEKVFPEAREGEKQAKQQWQQKKEYGGILGAIGETIMEIAQTTKELVIGKDQPEAHEASKTEYSKQEHH